jgi:PAS domain S-box-containing protein
MLRTLGQPQRRYLPLLGLLIAVYFAAGRLGLSLAFVNASASAVWPPTGIAVAALLVLGTHTWPAVAAGAFLVNLSTSGVVAASAAIAVGNTLEALAGAWLARRFARGVAAFDRTPDILRFVLAVMVAAAIAATIGVTALMATGLAPTRDASSIWITWWLGDAVGALIVTPLLILWTRPRTVGRSQRRGVEAGALVACVLVVSWIVFSGSPAGVANYPLAFLVIPTLLWSAFRFGARETATAATVVAGIAIEGTLRGFGPFARSSANESLLLLQAFIGVTTVMMLSVAAEVKRRRASETELRALNHVLEKRVTARTEELLRANDRLLEAQQVAHVGSWEWDVTSNTLWWSEELYRIFGLDPGDITGYEAFLARVHPDDRDLVDTTVQQAMVDGRSFTYDHRIVKSDGSIRVIHAAGRVVATPAGQPIRMTGIGHDITDRKKAEEARAALIREQAARHEAEEVSRAKDTFLAVLSHELRTPLNAALGWAHSLRALPPGDPRNLRATDAICRNLAVQARLVSDIMDVSRLSKGRLLLDMERVDVPALIDAAVEMVAEAAAARQITIETHAPAGAVGLVADSKRLQQVLWNLLSNAVTFGREGGYVRVVASYEPAAVSIAVEDDGPGIDPAFLPHVFEQFRQASESSTRPRHNGLGLGLSIARQIIEQHEGTITAANNPGGGCSFTIRLPLSSQAVVDSTRQ